MQHRDDIDFLADEPAPAPGDDVVDFGRGRLPRWVVALLVVAAVAIAATAIIDGRAKHAPKLDVEPAPVVTVSTTPLPSPAPLTASGVASALPLGTSPPGDITVTLESLYVAQIGRLIRVEPGTNRIVAQALVSAIQAETALYVVPDPDSFDVWVVAINDGPAVIMEFNAESLAPVLLTTWAGTISSVAALDGDLYLVGDGVAVITPSAPTPTLVPALAHENGPIAADPDRHRLLLLHLGAVTHVLTYQPGGALHDTGATLVVGEAEIMVAGGWIWVGGIGIHGAVLEQLDATTLRPGPNDPLAADLGTGAVLAAVGDDVLWVRSGVDDGPLWCVAAKSGAVQQRWDFVSGTVASQSGNAYIETSAAVQPLVLAGCSG